MTSPGASSFSLLFRWLMIRNSIGFSELITKKVPQAQRQFKISQGQLTGCFKKRKTKESGNLARRASPLTVAMLFAKAHTTCSLQSQLFNVTRLTLSRLLWASLMLDEICAQIKITGIRDMVVDDHLPKDLHGIYELALGRIEQTNRQKYTAKDVQCSCCCTETNVFARDG